MRTLLLTLLLVPYAVFSQSYEFGAMEAMGFATKINGEIHFKDGLFIVNTNTKNGVTTADYDIINDRNGVTYASDGVSTIQINISDISGKRKGYKYSNILSIKNPDGSVVLFYSKPKTTGN